MAFLIRSKESVLPQVIKLLESIEFIDAPEQAASSVPATSQPDERR
ncbi:hypothetical protein PSP6_200213 [Paraburkholderia tropica]|nr:hypothetical protein PSP6_200213 [Paraburkholderia tropica]